MGRADPMLPLATAVLRSGVNDPERVLALECDRGDDALFLAREFPRARVRGIDASAERVSRARARTGLDPEGRIAFKQGAPSNLPFPDDHFDLVVQAAGRLAPGEAARVLRPDGRLVLVDADPPRDPLRLRLRWRRRRLARGGFERLSEGDVGGGSFSVMRLRGRVPAPRSE